MSTPDNKQGSQYGSVQEILVKDIAESPFQVRLEYGDIAQLSDDIKKIGLLQPVLCRPVDGKLELVMGHRRARAVRKLGWTHIRSFVKEMSDVEAIVLQGSENLQRKNYNAIEEATLYVNYRNLKEEKKEKVGVKKIAKVFSCTVGNVKNKIGLLDLPKSIQLKIINEKIAVGSGIRLVTLTRELGDTAVSPKSMAGVADKARTEKYFPEIERIGLELEKARQTKGNEGLRTREGVQHTVSLILNGENVEDALSTAKTQEIIIRTKRKIAEGKTEAQITELMKKSVKDTDKLMLITRNLVLLDLKNNLKEKHIRCPNCGGDDLEWVCTHTRVVAND